MSHVVKKARTQQLLLETYVKTPTFRDESSTKVDVDVDIVSTKILQLLDPTKLDEYIPRTVVGDGNCLYRVMSLSMFNNEGDHIYERLKTALELCLHRSHYDVQSPTYTGQIHDASIVVSDIWTLLALATTPGGYSELMHIYACSAALDQAIESYYPLRSDVTSSFSRNVTGRDVTANVTTGVTCLMWTSVNVPAAKTSFTPNHFSWLQRKTDHAIHDNSSFNMSGPFCQPEDIAER